MKILPAKAETAEQRGEKTGRRRRNWAAVASLSLETNPFSRSSARTVNVPSTFVVP